MTVHAKPGDTKAAVDAFMAGLDHPHAAQAVEFSGAADLEARSAALRKVLAQWIRHV